MRSQSAYPKHFGGPQSNNSDMENRCREYQRKQQPKADIDKNTLVKMLNNVEEKDTEDVLLYIIKKYAKNLGLEDLFKEFVSVVKTKNKEKANKFWERCERVAQNSADNIRTSRRIGSPSTRALAGEYRHDEEKGFAKATAIQNIGSCANGMCSLDRRKAGDVLYCIISGMIHSNELDIYDSGITELIPYIKSFARKHTDMDRYDG